MKIFKLTCVGIFMLFMSTIIVQAKGKMVDVRSYKVVGDGTTLNTEKIQNLIDKMFNQGGGTLYFPAGDYLTGTLQMRSHVNFYLDKKATILGSTDPYQYRTIEMQGHPKSPRTDDNSQMALLVAYKSSNFSISGEGTIDGQGRTLALNIDSLHLTGERIDPFYSVRRNRPNETARPKLLRFSSCSNININGLHMRNSSCWGLSFELCDHLILNHIDIYSRAYWNNDGIDVTDCHNVRITNCNINSGDDGICLKSYFPGYTNDSIYIADCTVRSSASGIKFGTASFGGFKNILIERVHVFDTFRSAIAIESVDGGDIENVRVKNISGQNIGNAIFIRLGNRAKNNGVGIIKNIHISDCNFMVAFGRPDIDYDLRGPSVDFFHNVFPSSITGIPGHDIDNVTIDNVVITYPGRASKAMGYVRLWRLNSVPEKIKEYPEFSMFGELPAWGFYMRHAKNIFFNNVVLMLEKPDFRPAFVLDNVKTFKSANLSIPEADHKQIVYKSSFVSVSKMLKNECLEIPEKN